MAVAKTYEKMALVGEPFQENGKMYVNVQASKGIKKVRWYSDAEYRRMYPNTVIENDVMDFDARRAFGFDRTGFIFIYKGKNVEEWAENDRTNIWFNLTFGYFTPGNLVYPKLNEDIVPIKLMWTEVAAEGNRMKPHAEIQAYVNSLLSPAGDSQSQYQGVENEWLQKTVTIREKKTKDSRYGDKHTYTLEDSENNLYIWETGAKNYSIAQTVSLKMKVKAHEEINGEKCTIVWYCKEV